MWYGGRWSDERLSYEKASSSPISTSRVVTNQTMAFAPSTWVTFQSVRPSVRPPVSPLVTESGNYYETGPSI